ncbi:MAG: NUDIX hydrolase, partial [Ilumatobacteraceae bacterium]
PQAEFDAIYARVPRLTVEVVIASAQNRVVLTLRTLVDAVTRVARDELGVSVALGGMLGYIEYPSHYENGLDCPVGIAFAAKIVAGDLPQTDCGRFAELPQAMHDEQRRFLGNLLPTGP